MNVNITFYLTGNVRRKYCPIDVNLILSFMKYHIIPYSIICCLLHHPPEDISFDHAPSMQNPEINKDALIECRVSGSPTISWRYNGARITTGLIRSLCIHLNK